MQLPPIPDHLPSWQAGHIAWLASQGVTARYAAPDGTEPKRAYLSRAYLSRAYLSGADLSEADLSEADLSGADLSGADLTGANLSGAYLGGANLSEAVLSGAYIGRAYLGRAVLSGASLGGAYLSEADLSGADLSGAYLGEANLSEATGTASAGPVGRTRRMIYAVAHAGGPMIQAGCWWGGVDSTIERINRDYADDAKTRDLYIATVRHVAAMVAP